MAVVFMAVAAAIIIGSLGLPGSSREPMGPATVPRVVATVTMVLAAFMLVQALGRMRLERRAPRPLASAASTAARISATLGVMAAYALVVSNGWISVELSTMALIVAIAMVCQKPNLRFFIGSVIFAAVLALPFVHFLKSAVYVYFPS